MLVRLTLPFATPTLGRGVPTFDTIWLVFDSPAPIDITGRGRNPGRDPRNASVTRSREGQVVLLKLDKPKLTSIGAEGPVWSVVVGDTMLEPTQPLNVVRIVQGGGRASVTVPFEQPAQLHRLSDSEVGDTLLVVTALGPARGFLKPQEFVEFNALVSTHGVVIQPRARRCRRGSEFRQDRRDASGRAHAVECGRTRRDAGATARGRQQRASGQRPVCARSADAGASIARRISATARRNSLREPPRPRRTAHARAARPRALLSGARCPPKPRACSTSRHWTSGTTADDPPPWCCAPSPTSCSGAAPMPLKDLADPAVGNQNDAPLWRALALAQQGRVARRRARASARSSTATATLPIELQRSRSTRRCAPPSRCAISARREACSTISRRSACRASSSRSHRAERDGSPKASGGIADALTAYRAAAESPDRPGGRARAAARALAAPFDRRDEARRAIVELEIADDGLARRRDRGRGAADARPALHRGGPLSRRLPRDAHRAHGASATRR